MNNLLEETLELRAYQMRADNIWLVRELGVDLPRVQADAHQLQQVFVNLLNNAQQSMAGTGRGGVLTVTSCRILVVDDEETILKFLSEALRVRGHKVDCAANGLHALDHMRQNEYDAVITDLKMPGMNGRRFYEALQRESPGMAGKVIFATGDLVAQDTAAFLESTGDAYLEKPFSMRSIAMALRQLEC